MPKIQLYQDQIGQATPNPQAGVATVRNAGSGMASIAQLASAGAELAGQIEQNRRDMETAKAATEAIKVIDEQENYFLTEDKDFATHVERFQGVYKGLEDKARETLKSPKSFNEWKQNVELYAVRKGLRIKSNALNEDMKAQQSLLDSTLSDISGIAIRGDEQQYLESVAKGEALIDSSFDKGVLDSGERDRAKSKFKNELSRGKVRQDINNDPVAALENIRSNKYSDLSADEQSQFEAMAMSAIGQNKNRSAHELEKRSKELVSDTILSLKNGYEVREEEYSAALEAAKLIGNEEELRVARSASKYMLLPKADRDGLPGSIQGVNNAELRSALEAADKAINAELDRDAYDFAVKQRIVDKVEIDIRDPATIAARLDQVEYLKTHYGRPVSPLTSAEADMLIDALPTLSPALKTQLATAFGASEEIWKQLDKKNAGTFAMVGAIGDKDVMTNVFKGQQLIQTKMVDFTETNSELLAEFDEVVGGVYAGKDRQAIFEASKAYLAAKIGAGASGKEDFEDAIMAVSGGIAKINGNKIELPRGIDEDVFEDYIDGFTPDMVEAFGGVWSVPNEKAAQMIRKSKLVSVGNNRYAVDVGGAMLATKNGKPFTFSFDQKMADQAKAARKKNNRRVQ